MHFHHKQRGLPHRHQQKPTNQPMPNDCVLYSFFYTKSEARSHLKKVSLSYCSWFLLSFDDLWHQFKVEESSLDVLLSDQDPPKKVGEAISLHAATSLLRCHCITNPNNAKIRANHSTLPHTWCVWSSQSFSQTQNQKVLGTLATTSQHSAKLQVLPRFSRSLAKKNGRAHSPLGPADSNRINKLQTCKKPISWENVLKLKWGATV